MFVALIYWNNDCFMTIKLMPECLPWANRQSLQKQFTLTLQRYTFEIPCRESCKIFSVILSTLKFKTSKLKHPHTLNREMRLRQHWVYGVFPFAWEASKLIELESSKIGNVCFRKLGKNYVQLKFSPKQHHMVLGGKNDFQFCSIVQRKFSFLLTWSTSHFRAA